MCVQNAGRSQMAAALLDHFAEGRVHVRSAGSAPADQINPDVVAAMSELGIDVSKEFPKPMTDEVVQAADAVITMGCGDACPIYPGKRYEDWEVDDPADTGLDGVRRIRDDIGDRVKRAARRAHRTGAARAHRGSHRRAAKRTASSRRSAAPAGGRSVTRARPLISPPRRSAPRKRRSSRSVTVNRPARRTVRRPRASSRTRPRGRPALSGSRPRTSAVRRPATGARTTSRTRPAGARRSVTRSRPVAAGGSSTARRRVLGRLVDRVRRRRDVEPVDHEHVGALVGVAEEQVVGADANATRRPPADSDSAGRPPPTRRRRRSRARLARASPAAEIGEVQLVAARRRCARRRSSRSAGSRKRVRCADERRPSARRARSPRR